MRRNKIKCILQVISHFDPFLAEHIAKYGNPGSGHTSYLSSQTCNEFIELMGEKLRNEILKEMKAAKYFSIILDSTPDIAHVDELSYVFRYVQSDGTPIERFFCFLPNIGHKSEEMYESVMKTFEKYDINLSDCRGQAYDNAANMAGIYHGLQARIMQTNPLAKFSPCAAHSLNLVGTFAVEKCTEAASFFSLLQELYNFFSSSTQRWEILRQECSLALKTLSHPRWSATHDACYTLEKNWNEILSALEKLSNDDSEQKNNTKIEAKGLIKKIDRMETAVITKIWAFLLERINKVSKMLQNVDIDLSVVVELFDSLIDMVTNFRNEDSFRTFEENASTMSSSSCYELDMQSKRKRKRKVFIDETPEENSNFSGSENFRINCYYVILDNLKSELIRRVDAYKKLNNSFNAILNLRNLASTELEKKATDLQLEYKDDVDDNLLGELHHLKSHLARIETKEKKSPLQLMKWMREQQYDEIYPNVNILLQIFLTLPATNSSAERSFSALKRIKNYLRSRILAERTSCLALLAIEAEMLKKIDFNELIEEFANKKARRKMF